MDLEGKSKTLEQPEDNSDFNTFKILKVAHKY